MLNKQKTYFRLGKRSWIGLVVALLGGMVISGCQESPRPAESTTSPVSLQSEKTETLPTQASHNPPEEVQSAQPTPIIAEANSVTETLTTPSIANEKSSPPENTTTTVTPPLVDETEVESESKSLGNKSQSEIPSVQTPAITKIPIKIEPETTQKPTVVSDGNATPKITAGEMVYDFGEVGVRSKNTATFDVTNEGTGELIISGISKCCGAQITINDIDDVSKDSPLRLAPGQVAEVKAIYEAPPTAGKMNKSFSLITNDPLSPAFTFTIKAQVVIRLKCEPQQIQLSLQEKNAGFPPITLTSLDDKPFSILQFKSTRDVVSVAFDPNKEAKQITVQPQVDMDKLKDNLRGTLRFYLSREDHFLVECTYEVLKPYATNPATFLLFKADPAEPITKKLWILDNYAKIGGYKANLEVESIQTVDYDLVKVRSQRPLDDGIEVTLEFTPPDPVKIQSYMFEDTLQIRLKDEVDPIEIKIKGFYQASIIAEAKKKYRKADNSQ